MNNVVKDQSRGHIVFASVFSGIIGVTEVILSFYTHEQDSFYTVFIMGVIFILIAILFCLEKYIQKAYVRIIPIWNGLINNRIASYLGYGALSLLFIIGVILMIIDSWGGIKQFIANVFLLVFWALSSIWGFLAGLSTTTLLLIFIIYLLTRNRHES